MIFHIIVKGQSNALGVQYSSYNQATLDAMYGNYANSSNPNGRYNSLNGNPAGKYRDVTHKNIFFWENQLPYGIDAVKTYVSGTTPWSQVSPRQFSEYTPMSTTYCASSNPGSLQYSWWLPFACRLRDTFGAKVYITLLAVGGISFLDTGNPARQQYDPNLSGEFYDFAVSEISLSTAEIINLEGTIDHVIDLTDQGESDQISDIDTFKANHLTVKSGFKTAAGVTVMPTIARQIFQTSSNAATGLSQLDAENTDWHTLNVKQYSSKYNILAPIPLEANDGLHLMQVGRDWFGEYAADYYINTIYPTL